MRALPLCAVLAGCTFGADFAGTAYLCPAGDCPSGYTCVDGRCVSGGEPVDAAPPPSWWHPDWRARRRLAIRNPAGERLPAGFEVGWAVDLPSELGETAFEAVRVVSYEPAGDTWSEIPRVIDGAAAGDEMVWFPLPVELEPDAAGRSGSTRTTRPPRPLRGAAATCSPSSMSSAPCRPTPG